MGGFTQSQKKKIMERDGYLCVPHAGTCGGGLVVHHRANRGMGGRKSADTLSNGLTVCSDWNARVEADSALAEQARGYGWKIPTSWPPEHASIYYPVLGRNFYLDDDGGMRGTEDVPF